MEWSVAELASTLDSVFVSLILILDVLCVRIKPQSGRWREPGPEMSWYRKNKTSAPEERAAELGEGSLDMLGV